MLTQQINMDAFTREALVTVYGNFAQVRVTNEHDESVPTEKILETGHFTVSW